MVTKEYYESLGGRDGLVSAMEQALNSLRRFPYFGFVPEYRRAAVAETFLQAIGFMELHPSQASLPTRLLFPVLDTKKEIRLATFLHHQELQFCHRIMFEPVHDMAEKLYRATGIMYPEALMDLRVAYNFRFIQTGIGSIEDWSSTDKTPLEKRQGR